MQQQETDELEIDLLCEGIYRRYGFDFREYSRSSLKRRVNNLLGLERLATVSELQSKVLHDTRFMERFLLNLSISVTSMFRNPEMYLAFREKVVPLLKTYPSLRIWHAGCATGEEVYSMAILLKEEGLEKKTRIYATDFNEDVLKKAKAGIYPMSQMKEYTSNYIRAGGKASFSEYYSARYDNVILDPKLRKNIVFSKHNLATDSSFNEFNVIFCRNVMIYFNETLQERVHKLFHDSMCRFGILVLGNKESTRFTPFEKEYQDIDSRLRIYQRRK
ncbi:MAG: protein-glutamate O-methyltransferase CheR [Proteobacteria bacterium]|nr:protein-glutamate O-methyltransferase CheR [Pseudomonadota bacterium]